jgi:hypothetical protein
VEKFRELEGKMHYIHDESGNIRAYLQQAAEIELRAAEYRESAAKEMLRPFMLLRPKVFADGNKWCALLGENIQTGVCGFGDTPEQASKRFDSEWLSGKAAKG